MYHVEESDMADWNPWKLTSIGLGLVVATALVTGLVVANWSRDSAPPTETAATTPAVPPPPAAPAVTAHARHVAAARVEEAPAPRAADVTTPTTPSVSTTTAPAQPTQAAVDACNQYASTHVSQTNKTTEVVKDGAVGALVGAAVGAATGAIAGGGKGAGKGAAIGGLVGAGGGSLYGVNKNRQNEQSYRDAYASCMRSRGYQS